ncbi:DUF736 domain-containing protein [Asticcacaulis sp.]|uniref:DUF736 domain-containing protein n=1 Tax=Asticcacaulis sp. TaxID=1872648 RepID=UPI002CAC5FA9|nr:DUF736 domain-containing protein [Asticcacaulis sp.]HTM81914.1 DUF736 domain-containing protein [Asticcacaulis sp.]
MQPIGTFTKSGDSFTGNVRTLALNVAVRLVPLEGGSGQAPDYRIMAGNVEIGAGWKRTSDAGRDHVSLKLDDPSLPNPIYATLFPADEHDTHTLLWSRPKVS